MDRRQRNPSVQLWPAFISSPQGNMLGSGALALAVRLQAESQAELRLAKASPQDSHMVAIMLAVARWCSGNHKAASLAGEKMTRV